MTVPSTAATPDEVLLEQGLPVPALANALPDLVLAAAFVCAWARPAALPRGLGRNLLVTLLLEFIVLHSAAFMGSVGYGTGTKRKRVLGVLGLGCFYSLFALGFSLGFHSWWPLASFWLLTLNRLGGVLMRPASSGGELAYVTQGWAGGTVCYLLAVGVTTVLPLPRLGLDEAAVSALRLTGGGLWIAEPWHAFAAGAMYFALVAVNECSGWRAFRVRPRAAAPARLP